MTQRIQPASQEQRNVQDILETVQKKIGKIPNLYRVIGNSESVLQSYLAFNQSLNQVKIPPSLRQQIAVSVAGQNQCIYCASAHTEIGKGYKVSEEELKKNLHSDSDDPKVKAAMTFVKKVIQSQGHIEDRDLKDVIAAGYSVEEVIEIIAHIALNTFTNYVNNIAQTDIDFPLVKMN